MGFKCGIVGLPNVGKSTLFNALTKTASAQAENYPFCTIESQIGVVAVPDPRLEVLAEIEKTAKIVPAVMMFVDIAGLIRGASKGEGLGNQFLAKIREVDVIVHVLRCFDNGDVIHVDGTVDPISDAATVETELMLADLESVDRRVHTARKRVSCTREDKAVLHLMEKVLVLLNNGQPARMLGCSEEERILLRRLMLLTEKPVLYVCNVDELSAVGGNVYSSRVEAMSSGLGIKPVIISAKVESEIAQLPKEEADEFLRDMNLREPGLLRLIRVGYEKLSLITYFTAGPKEVRAWTIPLGTMAQQAAGVIHSEFEDKFIRASTVSYGDYVKSGGMIVAKEYGKVREEGKEYVVQDGDIMFFRCGR